MMRKLTSYLVGVVSATALTAAIGCAEPASADVPVPKPPRVCDSTGTCGPGSDNRATGLFVDSIGGDDGNDCTSPGRACRTLSRINSLNPPAGTDVWAARGSRFECEGWKPRHSGTASNRLVFGTYYLSGGEAWQGNGGGQNAEIRCSSGSMGAAIDLANGADYVTIQNVVLNGVDAGWALQAPKPQNMTFCVFAGNDSDFVRLENVRCSLARQAGIFLSGGSSDWVMENITADRVGHLWQSPGKPDSGAVIATTEGSDRVLIENSSIGLGGHNVLQMGGRDVILRKNRFFNDWCAEIGKPFCGTWPRGGRIAEFRAGACASGRCGSFLIEENLFDGVAFGANDAGTGPQQTPYHKLGVSNSIVRYNKYQSSDRTSIREVIDMSAARSNGFLISDNRIYGNYFQDLALDGSKYSVIKAQIAPGVDGRVARNKFMNNRVGAVQSAAHRFASFDLDRRDDASDPFDGNAWIDNCFAETVGLRELANGIGTISLAAAESRFPRFAGNLQDGACSTDDRGSDLAKATASGSGHIIPVSDARMFFGGLKIEQGASDVFVAADVLDVGGSRCTVMSVDYPANKVSCREQLSWSNGDSVNLAMDRTPRHGVPSALEPGDRL